MKSILASSLILASTLALADSTALPVKASLSYGAAQTTSAPPAFSEWSGDYAFQVGKGGKQFAAVMSNFGTVHGLGRLAKLSVNVFLIGGVDTSKGSTNGFALAGAAIAKTWPIFKEVDLKAGFGGTVEKGSRPLPTVILGASLHFSG
jgi:hypothetical protein